MKHYYLVVMHNLIDDTIVFAREHTTRRIIFRWFAENKDRFALLAITRVNKEVYEGFIRKGK